MSTKYILVGGYARKALDGGKAFCEELINGFSEPVKVLICAFAIPEAEWAERFDIDVAFLNKNLPNKKIDVRLTTRESFLEDLRWCNCVYLRGGNTRMFKKTLESFGNWVAFLNGKTVAGTSAGVDVLSTYNYNVDEECLDEGLGILPIKTITYFKSPDYKPGIIDWEKAAEDLKNFGSDLPIVALNEGEFIIKNLV